MPNLQGSCHCGQITLEFSTAMEPAAFSPRACQCSFCRRHSSVTIADPAGLLTLATIDQNAYRFGLAITDFHVCARCGVFVAATWKDQGGGVYGVVNVHALANARQFTAAPIEADFDGEDVSAREARRRTNWTPVRFQTRS